MAIIINKDTRVLVQGITGNQGSFHTRQMLAYGSNIVAGVSPGKAGQEVHGVPVFDTVAQAVEAVQPTASIIFIPAPLVKDAAFEAIDAGLKTVVIITEHVPLHDEMEIMAFARERGTTVVGPNTFGIISPGQCKMGIMPNQIFLPGKVGVVARSGTLSYEIVYNLTRQGLGQSTVVGLGGDRVVGLSFVDVLQQLEADPDTEAVILVGEIGGNAEEVAAEYIKTMTKPVVAFLAGKSAPPGKRMGHAGAIVERGKGTFASKVEALTAAGARVAELPWQVPELLKQALKK
ncbi:MULTISPECIES: succinate--CoA ligase subunit alpha [Carboxydocella]|uniref:Succinate--CoA ligase [ADP-forming] subunit alpha n=2 Tax=Carboxydocella TaxID=178898 RepID=A0A1T4LBW2_9FIRM|nr:MULTISPECIES: succinate--CoA ligase subunit alpha [Carboxydocella]AVX19858.1 succinyl-CoA synthetase alpha subunit [Carboxydocella thermautotrophica]AVX30267.1 succinyl-CoA synthetase alpha subunit [Carboxydocella thermautotrophica]GAW30528.1 succinyl-CoA synthetase subunit alpha [Carboxydocella sp. JDF658]SJZ52180.1 succinyl-CoA synthetase alpha subunit [Carboxydocella sporoproducens DSM 16521]